jgi:DNA-binding transcriptional regulator YiaG
VTPDRFRECLDALNWTQPQLAAVLDMGDRQVRRWAAGDPMPEHIAAWLEKLAQFAEANPPPPRPSS